MCSNMSAGIQTAVVISFLVRMLLTVDVGQFGQL